MLTEASLKKVGKIPLSKPYDCNKCMWKGVKLEGTDAGTFCEYSDKPIDDCPFWHRNRGTPEEEVEWAEKLIDKIRNG